MLLTRALSKMRRCKRVSAIRCPLRGPIGSQAPGWTTEDMAEIDMTNIITTGRRTRKCLLNAA